MNVEELHWPFPNRRALPPSNPTPSQVSEGIGGLGGRDRTWEFSHGTSVGGSDRTWEFSHGRHGAFMCQGTRRPLPNPGFLPPSNPHPSKVGDGLIIQGDLDGRAAAAVPGGGAAANACIPAMPLAELVDHSRRNVSHSFFPSYQCARPLQAEVLHAKISYPTQQPRTAPV